ncbi:MAG TPA: hypothetical protein VMW47_13445 [Verrucomicrobiae bacterium]|nr:hypothetical protein [Verrucomicrobiae bacterium]
MTRGPGVTRSKLTPERSETILGLVRSGNYLQTACQYAGIDPGTLSRWLAKGRQDREQGRRTPHAEFAEACARAEAHAEAVRIQRVAKAAETDWKADAWYLERRFPDRWGDRRTIAMAGALDVRVDQAFVLSPESALVAADLLAHLGGSVIDAEAIRVGDGWDSETERLAAPGSDEHRGIDGATEEPIRSAWGHRTGLAEVPQPVRTPPSALHGHGVNGPG